MEQRKTLSKGFACSICKSRTTQNGFVLGLKEAFTVTPATMVRLCDRCYKLVTSHMVYLAKTIQADDETALEWTDADDIALLKELGIKVE